ncbi:MAG: cbb3-type cytochrome oxidase assembly protein CcoS [Zoogloeaceae bacterium]|jgi:cbb3-type cytochrome oxidase maturation protein|nr:cbb3-type cytochrome oxidase assembly protein CcoS [Zoogloeaceae bacterium]
MESLYLLIPLSVLLVFLIGLIFWWSIRSGQFDDLEGPGYRVLMDDDRPSNQPSAEAAEVAEGQGGGQNRR